MGQQYADIYVFGAENACASCVHLPSTKETVEWLEAAISRKFPDQPFSLTYVDIYHPPENERLKKMAQTIIEEEWFYPVVAIGERIVGSGDIRIKKVFEEMERLGYTSKNK